MRTPTLVAIVVLAAGGLALAADPAPKAKKDGDWTQIGEGRWRYTPGKGKGPGPDPFKIQGGGSRGGSDHGSAWKWKPIERAPLPYRKELKSDQLAHIDALLKQTYRPTIAELERTLKAAYGEIPRSNPFGSGGRMRGHDRDVAQMIAQLELAYPGGTYVPVGRDAVLVADILDAYYRSIGQPDRVSRLNASGPSFPHYHHSVTDATAREDAPLIAGFVRSSGLDFDRVTADRPYVMIDVTPYAFGSQSRQLMRSVFREWSRLGRDPKDLADKVAFVGIPMGGGRDKISDAVAGDIAALKAKVKASTTKDGPSEILWLGGGSMSSLTYSRGWHEMFERFTRGPGGVVTTAPGSPADRETREGILEEQVDILHLIAKPSFQAEVREVAEKDYGYVFPMKRTATLTRTAAQPVKAKPRDEPRFHGFPSAASRDFGESAFVKAAKYRLKKDPSPEHAAEFLADLAGMYGRSSVDNAEVRTAVRAIAKIVDLKHEKVQAKLRELEGKHAGFTKQVRKGMGVASAILPGTLATSQTFETPEPGSLGPEYELRSQKFGSGYARTMLVTSAKGQLVADPSPAKAIEIVDQLAGMFGRHTLLGVEVREVVAELSKVADLTNAKVLARVKELERAHPGFEEQVEEGLTDPRYHKPAPAALGAD